MSDKKAMIKAGGLWKSTDSNGNDMFSGSMGGVRVLVFTNTYKEDGDNKPDFQMYFAENERRDNAE
jgi:hypothetical protein